MPGQATRTTTLVLLNTNQAVPRWQLGRPEIPAETGTTETVGPGGQGKRLNVICSYTVWRGRCEWWKTPWSPYPCM